MTTLREVFAAAGMSPMGCVRWGTGVPLQSPGVYAIATTADMDDPAALAVCPIDAAAVSTLMQQRPEIAVDGTPATEQSLSSRLTSMWLPSEPVLYVGLAGVSLGSRIDQYYKTPLGARSPHAGGWPLKMLSILGDLWVHYAASDNPDRSEVEMVGAFVRGVPNDIAAKACDPSTAVPYANLMFPGGRKKLHGISGAKEARTPRAAAPSPPRQPAPIVRTPSVASHFQLRTQRITSSDIAGGRVRIPKETKSVFPRERQRVDIEIRGETLTCRWDPRTGPDKERSGVLGVPKAVLQRLVQDDEELTVTATGSGFRLD